MRNTLLLQIIISIVGVLFVLAKGIAFAAFSVFLGSLCAILPAGFFLWYFSPQQGRQNKSFLTRFYVGIFFKFALMALLFYLCFKFFKISGVWFIGAFVLNQFITLFRLGK